MTGKYTIMPSYSPETEDDKKRKQEARLFRPMMKGTPVKAMVQHVKPGGDTITVRTDNNNNNNNNNNNHSRNKNHRTLHNSDDNQNYDNNNNNYNNYYYHNSLEIIQYNPHSKEHENRQHSQISHQQQQRSFIFVSPEDLEGTGSNNNNPSSQQQQLQQQQRKQNEKRFNNNNNVRNSNYRSTNRLQRNNNINRSTPRSRYNRNRMNQHRTLQQEKSSSITTTRNKNINSNRTLSNIKAPNGSTISNSTVANRSLYNPPPCTFSAFGEKRTIQIVTITNIFNQNMLSFQELERERGITNIYRMSNYSFKLPFNIPQSDRFRQMLSKFTAKKEIEPQQAPFPNQQRLMEWQSAQLEQMNMHLLEAMKLYHHPYTAYILDTSGILLWSKEWDFISNQCVYNPPSCAMRLTSSQLQYVLSNMLTYFPEEWIGQTKHKVVLAQGVEKRIEYHCVRIDVTERVQVPGSHGQTQEIRTPKGYLVTTRLCDDLNDNINSNSQQIQEKQQQQQQRQQSLFQRNYYSQQSGSHHEQMPLESVLDPPTSTTRPILFKNN